MDEILKNLSDSSEDSDRFEEELKTFTRKLACDEATECHIRKKSKQNIGSSKPKGFSCTKCSKKYDKNNIFRDTCCLTKGGLIAPIAQSHTPGKTTLFVTERRGMVKR